MRFIYTILFYFLLPFILIRLLWRSIKTPEYRKGLSQRLGFYAFGLEKCIWVHAVSVGETIAAVPLVQALKIKYPQYPILITTMTVTGANQVKASFGESVAHAYIPYDLPYAMKRFFNAMQPIIGLIMETELWPNLLALAHQQQFPICLMNARLSEKSAKGYQLISFLTHSMMQNITMIAAHGIEDAKRFIALGASKEKVIVTGNIKFDLELNDDVMNQAHELRKKLGINRFVWIAASTHDGEEEIILATHKKILESTKDALLILVPRHPNRFEAIAKMAAKNFVMATRSLNEEVLTETSLYLGDTMGELLVLYGASDVAFVGGSLIPRGGHNMLEPAAFGKPILTGSHLFNFKEISQLLAQEKALIIVKEQKDLIRELSLLIKKPMLRQEMGLKAKKVMMANGGALEKQLKIIESLLNAMDS